MHAPLVRESSLAHPGRALIVPHVGDFIDELRELFELGHRFFRDNRNGHLQL
jgi:hypothetical protein